MPAIYEIKFGSEALDKIPADERTLLLSLGWATNQVVMLQKLLWFSTNHTSSNHIELHGTQAYSQMLTRLLVGVVFESWELIRTRFLSQRTISQEYTSKMKPDAIDALTYLKRAFGNGGLLKDLRNRYAFHYPDNAEIETAFRAAKEAPSDPSDWNIYFSSHPVNSLYQFAEHVFNRGMSQQTGENDAVEAHKALMDQLSQAAHNIERFSGAVFEVLWIKHFGRDLDSSLPHYIQAESADHIRVPFFVERP